jgi:hypothetical protein
LALLCFRRCDITDDAVVAQSRDFLIAEPERIAQNLLVVLTERRRELFDRVRQFAVALAIGD